MDEDNNDNTNISIDDYIQGCKYLRHEPYMTPNNYDIYFDYHSIPSNIHVENARDLRKRLQRLMPLTKIIHVNMDEDAIEHDNNIHLSTSMRLIPDNNLGVEIKLK